VACDHGSTLTELTHPELRHLNATPPLPPPRDMTLESKAVQITAACHSQVCGRRGHAGWRNQWQLGGAASRRAWMHARVASPHGTNRLHTKFRLVLRPLGRKHGALASQNTMHRPMH